MGVCEVLAFRSVSELPALGGCNFYLLGLGELLAHGICAGNHARVFPEGGVNNHLDGLDNQFRLVLHDPVAAGLR